jgi:ABC-2 type transport system ATP-binding protein
MDKLSKGMAQKVQLATSVVNRPRLLMLDEPFSGLDPVNQGLLEDEIRRAAAGGATVVFSTHVMQHAERLCDRLLLLAKGRKKFEGTLDQARGLLPARLSVIARQSLAGQPGVERVEDGAVLDSGWHESILHLQPGVEPGDVLERCFAAGIVLRRFEERRPSLHDVFLHMVGPTEARI